MFGFSAERPVFSWLLSHLGPLRRRRGATSARPGTATRGTGSLPASRGSAPAPRAAMPRSAMAPLEPDNYVFTNR